MTLETCRREVCSTAFATNQAGRRDDAFLLSDPHTLEREGREQRAERVIAISHVVITHARTSQPKVSKRRRI
jgi:hypothetical protein